jgi:hypothetical protein
LQLFLEGFENVGVGEHGFDFRDVERGLEFLLESHDEIDVVEGIPGGGAVLGGRDVDGIWFEVENVLTSPK